MPRVLYCVEDSLSRAILQRLFKVYCEENVNLVEMVAESSGVGKMRAQKNFKNFFEVSNREPVFVLMDLDRSECPPTLRKQWISNIWRRKDLPQKMFFCIAEVEVESWLLSDPKNFSRFFEISERKISPYVKNHSKENLLQLIKSAKKKSVKSMLHEKGSNSKTGPFYNEILINFVEKKWSPHNAISNSPSLAYTVKKIRTIETLLHKVNL